MRMGHYFGLLHPWGNFIGCDDEDDGIEDTPFQAAPNFYCQSILNCNTYTKPGNIMDFTADECLEYFTRMQATAMQQFAVTHKSKLIASSDCFEENLPLDRDFITINTIVGSVEIYFDTSDKYESVMLFDLQGRLISLHPSKGQSFLNISTEGICPGIYVLQIIRADKRFARKIFTK